MNQNELAELVRQYQPDEHVLAGLSAVNLFMLVGPTGVGKSALMKVCGLPQVIGEASRAPRQNEVDGVDYYFKTLDEMLQEADSGRYVQLAIGSEGDLKATHAASFPAAGPAVFTVAASAIPTFRHLPFASTISVVLVPPDYQTWMQRISHHHTSPDKLAIRLEEARQSYNFALQDEDSIFVFNDTLEKAAIRLHDVVAGKVPEDSEQARAVAADLLLRITSA